MHSTVTGGGIGPQANAPRTYQLSAFERMVVARRWMLWKPIQKAGRSKPDKVPYYVDGTPRGETDTLDDRVRLAPFHIASDTLDTLGNGWQLGFALGSDGNGGYWQGIDFDDVAANYLGREANAAPGYVEVSPSGKGAHSIGYGRQFATLGSNGTGIEAYAWGRFFTVTRNRIRDSSLVCLADYVERELAPRHGAGRAVPTTSGAVELVTIDAKTVTELRSALLYMRADAYEIWYRMGLALKELGETGRGLWMEWSATSDKFNPKEAAKKWDGFVPRDTGYQAVFAQAQHQGWVNPASSSAKPDSAAPPPTGGGQRKLIARSLAGVQARSIEWLWTGWIPKGYITIFAGETGAGKSTVLADVTARVTTGAPWPGEFGQEAIRPAARVLWLGSEDSIEEMTIPRLMACGADLRNVTEIQGVTLQGKRNTFSMQDDLEEVGQCLASARNDGMPFAMLVIDPVTSYLPGQKLRKVDLNDAGQLRTILEPWLVLAQQHGIAIVCVTHFAKDTTRAMLHRVLGSAAFAQTCRSLCAVIEPPATEDYEPGPFEKALVQVKVNLPEHPGGSWKFSTEKVEVAKDPRNGKAITATRPNWEQLDGALTPKTAVERPRGPKSQQALPFAMWVKALFITQPGGTWLPVDQVKWSAVREKAASESWWNKHSHEYLDKMNTNGTWMCRPKDMQGGG